MTAPPPRLDAAVLAANLTALARRQPAIVKRLKAVAHAADVPPVWGRDGSPTFRILDASGALRYLGHSSMPGISSAALVRAFNAGTGNVMVAGMGHGGEARRLLDSLPRHRAVFTWDETALPVALAMRLHDFSEAINGGQLVLAIGDTPDDALHAAFADYPRHLPPAAILVPPHHGAAQLHMLRSATERAVATRHRQLGEAFSAARRRLTSACASADVAIVSMIATQTVLETAVALHAAACNSGRSAVISVPDGPHAGHALAVIEALAASPPRRAILLDSSADELGTWWPTDLPATSWYLGERHVTQHPAGAFSTTACDDATLLLPAVDLARFKATTRRRPHAIGVMLDTCPDDPEQVDLRWDSHRQLWVELNRLLTDHPQRLTGQSAGVLVERAIRRARITLDACALRDRVVEIVRTRLAPTLALMDLCKSCADLGPIHVWGHHWNSRSVPDGLVTHPSPRTVEERCAAYQSCRVVLQLRTDAFAVRDCLEAVASGAAVVRHHTNADEPVATWRTAAGAIPGFARTTDARALLARCLETTPDLSEALRTIERSHTFAARLETLLGSSPEPSDAAPSSSLSTAR